MGLAVVALACGGSNDTRDADVRTFRSRTYVYSIEYPAEWSVVPAEEPLEPGQPPLTGPPVTDILAKRADRVVRKMTLPALVVGAQSVPADMTIDDWTTNVIDIAGRQKQCGDPRSTEHRDIGGEPATLLSYPDCPKGAHLDHLWAAVVHRGRGMHFVFFDAVGHDAANRKRFDRMLSSVSFEEPDAKG
jgi:hypothetical protein